MVTQEDGIVKDAYKYVMGIALDLGIPSNDPKLKKIISSAEGKTQAEINKKIVTLSKVTMKKRSELSEEQIKEINNIKFVDKEAQLKELNRIFNTKINDARSYNEEFKNKLKEATQQSAKIMALNNSEAVNNIEQINEIIANPFYEFEKVENGALCFIAGPVVINFEKRSAKVKYDINLGYFRVSIKPTISSVIVRTYKDNLLTSRNYYHPHVDTNGSVCWGNAFNAVKEMAATGDMLPAMSAIESLLKNYNEESPYDDISLFKEAQDQKEAMKGKVGDRFIDPREIITLGYAYSNIGILDYNYAQYLKNPIIVSSINKQLIFITTVNAYGEWFVELKDGSYLKKSKLFNNNDTSITAAISVSGLEKMEKIKKYIEGKNISGNLTFMDGKELHDTSNVARMMIVHQVGLANLNQEAYKEIIKNGKA